jgi:anti-sigma B factor antagonist
MMIETIMQVVGTSHVVAAGIAGFRGFVVMGRSSLLRVSHRFEQAAQDCGEQYRCRNLRPFPAACDDLHGAVTDSVVSADRCDLTLFGKPKRVDNISIQAGDFTVQVIRKDSQVTVEIGGRVTIDSSPHLRLFLLRQIGRKAGAVMVIDVSKVSYLDSSGIATLLESLRAARQRSVKLHLVGTSGRVRMLAELLELPKIYDALGSEVVFT